MATPTRDEIQEDAIAAIFRERASVRRSTLLQMPTQTGKTRTICKYIKRVIESHSGRILVVAHMGELLIQFAAELESMGIPFLVEKAEQKALDAAIAMPSIRVILASKDTIQKGRLAAWPKDFFTDIIFDECHRATAETFSKIIRHFEGFIIGMTATIDRLDGVPLSTVFESTAYVYRIEDAIRNGHRCPFKVVECDVDIDIKGLKVGKSGKLKPGELEARISPKLNEIANVVHEHIDRLGIDRFIAFLPDVGSAYEFARILTQIGLPSKAVHGLAKDRSFVIAEHKAGAFVGLVNQKLLGEGYNDPKIKAVILLNPTTSRARLDQAAGRCGATCEGKESGYLFSFGWDSELSLVGPTDIFAGDDCSERVRKKARELARTAPEDSDPQLVLEQAKVAVATEEDREKALEERRAKYKAKREKVRHSFREFDPIGVAVAAKGQEALSSSTGEVVPATPGQVRALDHWGIDASGMNHATAKAAIEYWSRRELLNLASVKQVEFLMKRKLPQDQVLSMTATEARNEFLRITKKI